MAIKADLRDSLMSYDKFNDPFLLNSSLYIPKKFRSNLDLAAYLAAQFPSYTQATKRTVSHFITDIQFTGEQGDGKEKDALKQYLIQQLEIMEVLQQAGMEYFIYGNAFIRIYYPFNRYLVDRRDGGYREYSVTSFGDDISFDINTMTYEVPDPREHGPVHQRNKVKLGFKDFKCTDPKKIKIMLIDPRRMTLHMNYVSGTIDYIWRFDEFFIADVKAGNKIWQINETPERMLRAIKEGKDFKFNSKHIFHMANNFISGISYNGWGIPNILLNYRSIHQMAVLRCINEAIGLDYMLPIRLLSPATSGQGGGADAASALNMGPWTNSMRKLIDNKRKDPTALHVVPFPVTYQELGGQGKALAPVELMQYAADQTMNDFGYPAELQHLSLQTAEVPTAIRMFESVFNPLYHKLNKCVQWINQAIAKFRDKQIISVKLTPPTMADDLEIRHIYLQLAAGGEVSRATAYKPFGVDNAVEEAKRRMEEDIQIQKAQQKIQEEAEREQTLGSADQTLAAMLQAQQGPPPEEGGAAPEGGGQPVGGSGGGGGRTPVQVMQEAQDMAQQLLQIEDNGERRKQMDAIRADDETLYALVKQKMEEMRSQGASEGRKMAGKG